ncbi:MAG: YSC84-related protein [Terriglobales bacterium]
MSRHFSRTGRAALAVILVSATCSMVAQAQSDTTLDEQRINNAIQIFRSVASGPGRQIPVSILKSGQCVMIIPSYKTLAFGIGGAYGKGIAMCRLQGPTANSTALPPATAPKPGATPLRGWSGPIFVTMGGASLGPQIGIQSADLILVFQHRAGLESMLNNKLRLGVSASAAAGPIGRSVHASTDATMRAEVVAYARSRGLFAGVNINGAVVQTDETGNRAMYPHQYWQDVLDGTIRPTAAAGPLVAELDHSPLTNPALRPPTAGAVPAARMGEQSTMTMGPGLMSPLPFSVGFGYEHISSPIGLDGWDLRAGVRPLPRRAAGLSLVADVGRASGSQSLSLLVGSASAKSTEWTLMFGPEFDMPHRIFDPYADALFGFGHLSTQTASVNASGSSGYSSFAWQVGAGLKLNVTRWASIRLIEVDLVHTAFAASGSSHARVVIGGTIHF